jgi:hypothetical protein
MVATTAKEEVKEKAEKPAPADMVSVVLHFNERMDAVMANLYMAVHENDKKSMARHDKTIVRLNELTNSVQVLADRRIHNAPCDELKASIYKQDWAAHNDGHASESERKAENAELLKKIKVEFAKYAIAGISVYFLTLVWHDVIRALHA